MIIIQIVLIAGFIVFLYKVIADPSSYKLKAWTKLLSSVFVTIAVAAVLAPDLTNTVAGYFGVTRGADLLLYTLTMAFIFTMLRNYIQEKRATEKIVMLARKIAIIETDMRDLEKNSKDT